MTHRNPRMPRALVAAALALGLVTGPALAAGNEEASSASGSADRVTDAELEKFAEAYGQIQSVRAEYGPRIRQAEDEAQRSELKKEGRQEMTAAIQDAGLEIAEYKQIGQQLNGDKQLQARLQKLVRNEQSGQQQGSGQQQ